MSKIVLRYVGGGAYQAGVPACDLTQETIDALQSNDATNWSLEDILALRHGGQPLYVLADSKEELTDGE